MVVAEGVVKTWSKNQSVIARSSGEAELYSLNKGLSEALGLRSLGRDLGWNFSIRAWVDSSAAKSIVARQGLGKTRHIDVEFLWSQNITREKFISVRKVRGTENPADILTKAQNLNEAKRLLGLLGIEIGGEVDLERGDAQGRGGVFAIRHTQAAHRRQVRCEHHLHYSKTVNHVQNMFV